MNRKQRKAFSKASIIAMIAAAIPFTACDYIGAHSPIDDNPIQVSSSSKVNPTSSSVMVPWSPFETWYGFELTEQIQTGLANETETAGYWFEYNDSPDGGLSRILWPALKGSEYSDQSMLPIIEVCNGICGTYDLDKGNLMYNPFVGIGFNVVGERSSSDVTPAVGDASSWGGVCVSYTSDMAFSVEMGLGEEMESLIDYAVPAARLPKSTNVITKRLAWTDFKQPSWYKGNRPITGVEASRILSTLRFLFQGADKSRGNFNIMAVGPFDGCDNTINPVDPPKPVDPPNPVDPTSNFETWIGNEGIYKINTGFDNETETAGYWYSFDDAIDGGESHIVWPTALGTEYDDNALDPVIDFCGGLCGTAVLSKGTMTYNPFLGVGFNMVGETSITDPTPMAADASSMGGICISYTSDAAPALEMSFGDEIDQSIGYAQPVATLPKSTVGTTKFIKWSDFKQPSWYKGDTEISGEQGAAQLVALRFKLQAAPGEYNFNIQAIGPYSGGTCHLTSTTN